MKVLGFLASSALIVATICSPTFANTNKSGDRIPNAKLGSQLIKELSNSSEDKAHSVLVYLKEQAQLDKAIFINARTDRIRFVYNELTKTARTSQKELISFLKEQKLEFTPYYIANLVVVHGVTAEQINQIAERDDVLRILGNPKFNGVKLAPTSNVETEAQVLAAVEESIKSTGAPKVWEELKAQGEGIIVAGQDTGVEYDHPALVKQYRGNLGNGKFEHNYNWHDSIHKKVGTETSRCGVETKVPCDDHAHGTHTMGTIVGSEGDKNQVGMAPKAKWIACKNMDAGVGTPATYIECFQFFLAPYAFGEDPMTKGDPTKAPHVINNSWGCPADEGCEGGEFAPVLQSLKAAGVMVVASAGNDGPGCSTIKTGPAFHSDTTLSVGAINHRTSNIASFSSRGPSTFDNQVGPDLSAPGVSIRSAVPGKKYESGMWSGTSMAGPHVVGAVALLWSANRELIGNIEKTSKLLTSTASPKTSSENCGNVEGTKIPNNTYGYGNLDVYKAATTK